MIQSGVDAVCSRMMTVGCANRVVCNEYQSTGPAESRIELPG
jgi:hypothetical protein